MIATIINIFYQIFRTARPRQWLKNLSLFAAPVFSGLLFENDVFFLAIKCFVAFCAVSSGAYFINDLSDIEKDRKHPIKKNRPIASGKLTVKFSWFIAIVLILFSVAFSYRLVGTFFTLSVLVYIVIQF